MKSNLSCHVARDLLPQYAEGLLSPESEEELRTHLAECPACSKIYADMTSPEPDFAELAEVDYLKKLRRSRRRLVLCGLLALALIAAAAFFGLRHRLAQNAVSYDAASGTVVIYGNSAGDKTVLPPEVNEATTLDAQFDSFHLSAYLPHLRQADPALESALPQYLNRTEKSLAFIRSYLMANCADQYPTGRAAKFVELTIHPEENYSWSERRDRIKLELGSYYWHREELYILALLGSRSVQWKQLGYAWYLGSCVDPHSELLLRTGFDSLGDLPYADFYANAGGSAEATPENYRRLNDAIACQCLTKGMYWGSNYESTPLRWTVLYKAGGNSSDPGDTMSVCMATSFIAWLSDRYGFDHVSSFCFGKTTFEEAFGTDYGSAYGEWSAWILQRCGAELP